MKLRHWTLKLPSGGTVEITDDERVLLGDGFTFRQLTYTSGGCTIVFEVRDGVPGAVSITLNGDGILRQKDLTAIRLDDIRAEVYAVAGIGTFSPDGHFGPPMDDAKRRKTLNKATSGRKMQPDRLREVAKIYKKAPSGGRHSAIATAFGVSERQAWRYIAQAKEKGLIDGND